MNLVERALSFAKTAHAGQKRKGDGRPYITHPISVMGLLAQAGVEDEEVLAAALLHDVVEDCGVTRDQLRKEFGDRVAGIVWEVSKVPERGLSRKQYLQSFAGVSVEACALKLADRTHNLSDDTGWAPEPWYWRESMDLLRAIGENPGIKWKTALAGPMLQLLGRLFFYLAHHAPEEVKQQWHAEDEAFRANKGATV